MSTGTRLGIGFIGSGFMTRFHLRSWVAVRDADVLGIWSPTAAHREEAAAMARELGVGAARPYDSITAMVADPAIDCLWIVGPNHARLACMEEIVDAHRAAAPARCAPSPARSRSGATSPRRGACSRSRAKRICSTAISRTRCSRPRSGAAARCCGRAARRAAGRPYLARAAEEHSGPHNAWFWRGELQGGGVLSDMMCHSVEVARFLVTDPAKPRASLTPKRVNAQVATLKWSRPEYAAELRRRFGAEVDYQRRPAEDFARVMVEYEDDAGLPVLIEATTSWSFVGPGLRLSMEVLGPEYSMRVSSLDTELELFLSRATTQAAAEDLVEKQNAETGLMPIVPNESATYGYEEENRHMVSAFRAGKRPAETFEDGVAVAEILMAAYMSAERGATLDFPPAGLESFVPAVARSDRRSS